MIGERTPRLLIKYLIRALLIAALLLILHPPAAEYLDLLRQGERHAEAAERTAAVAAYREAAHLRPDDPLPYLRLARVYLDWGRVDEAREALGEAERLGAGEMEVLRLRVGVCEAQSEWRSLAEHARRLLELAPDDCEARRVLARAYVNLQDWDAARSVYRALLRDDSTGAGNQEIAHERLGVLLLGENTAAAVQHLLAAETELADRLLAVLEKAGETESPQGAFGRDPYVSALLGRALLEAQEWALAARQFKRALARRPDYSDAHAYLGCALDQMGYEREAGEHLSRAVALAPDSAVAHTLLGLHYKYQGDLPRARAELETAYDLDRDNPAICVEIGQTWATERRYEMAEIWLREAVSLQPDDSELWETLVRFYLEHHITASGKAVEAAAELVEMSPEDARAHDLRGWAAFQAGDLEKARQHLQRAIALDPTLAAAHYHLGLLWEAEGRRGRAHEAFTRALDLDTSGRFVPFVERAMRASASESD